MYAIKAGSSGLEKSRSGIGPLSIFNEVEEITATLESFLTEDEKALINGIIG